MFELYVHTEVKIENEDLVRFVKSQGGVVAHESLSYPIEDKTRGSAVFLSMCDDPDVPERIRRSSEETGKMLSSAVTITVAKRSFEFAISVASLIVSKWGGLADIDRVDPATLKLAEHHNLSLWIEKPS